MQSFTGFDRAVVVDVETTGLVPNVDRIVSVAALKVDFAALRKSDQLQGESFVALYDPDRPIPEDATRVHGLTDADVAGKPKFADEARDLRAFIGELPLIAHNLKFDRGFLAAEFKRAGVRPLQFNRGLCTMVRFQEDNGGRRKGSRLEDAARAMGVPGRKGGTHDAEEDAVMAMQIAGGYYCIDNGIDRPGRGGGWLKGALWLIAIVAGLALFAD